MRKIKWVCVFDLIAMNIILSSFGSENTEENMCSPKYLKVGNHKFHIRIKLPTLKTISESMNSTDLHVSCKWTINWISNPCMKNRFFFHSKNTFGLFFIRFCGKTWKIFVFDSKKRWVSSGSGSGSIILALKIPQWTIFHHILKEEYIFSPQRYTNPNLHEINSNTKDEKMEKQLKYSNNLWYQCVWQ